MPREPFWGLYRITTGACVCSSPVHTRHRHLHRSAEKFVSGMLATRWAPAPAEVPAFFHDPGLLELISTDNVHHEGEVVGTASNYPQQLPQERARQREGELQEQLQEKLRLEREALEKERDTEIQMHERQFEERQLALRARLEEEKARLEEKKAAIEEKWQAEKEVGVEENAEKEVGVEEKAEKEVGVEEKGQAEKEVGSLVPPPRTEFRFPTLLGTGGGLGAENGVVRAEIRAAPAAGGNEEIDPVSISSFPPAAGFARISARTPGESVHFLFMGDHHFARCLQEVIEDDHHRSNDR